MKKMIIGISLYATLYLGIFLYVTLFSGCTVTTEENKANLEDDVYEITLSDGTICAVYRGYRKGGIDCNWNNQQVTVN